MARNLAAREKCTLSAISQEANRGAGLVFGNFAIGTAERIGASLAQEFLFGKFTRRGGHMRAMTRLSHPVASTRNLLVTCASSFTPARDSCYSGPGFIARAPASCMDPSSEGHAEVSDAFDNFNSRHKLTKTRTAILALRVREVWQAPCLCS
jgi:hypothetical protein